MSSDPRFTMGLLADVAAVLERHGYPRLPGPQLVELQLSLFRVLHGVRSVLRPCERPLGHQGLHGERRSSDVLSDYPCAMPTDFEIGHAPEESRSAPELQDAITEAQAKGRS